MGFFGRLFGAGTTADKIERAYARQDWAEVVALADLLTDEPGQYDQAALNRLVADSGEHLARINLEQAEACLRSADRGRAREHLELVIKYGQGLPLCDTAQRLLGELDADVDVADGLAPVASHNCSSCGSDGPSGTDAGPPVSPESHGLFDDEQAWELTLAALPAHWSASYAQLTPVLQQAVLLAHSGQDAEAKQLLLDNPQPELSAVIDYELAGLYLRNRELPAGLALLETLLRDFPQHDLALQLAIDLVFQRISPPWLPACLQHNLEQGNQPGLSHTGLAKLAAVAGDEEALVQHTLGALENNVLDPELLVWAARSLEKRGQVVEAEQLLQHLPHGGGCSGGSDPLLGEFWLRQGRNADQALNSFKAAARQDPENPRWALRIAQAYLLKGWKREAGQMLRQILLTPQLEENLRAEAEAALAKTAG